MRIIWFCTTSQKTVGLWQVGLQHARKKEWELDSFCRKEVHVSVIFMTWSHNQVNHLNMKGFHPIYYINILMEIKNCWYLTLNGVSNYLIYHDLLLQYLNTQFLGGAFFIAPHGETGSPGRREWRSSVCTYTSNGSTRPSSSSTLKLNGSTRP